MRRPAHDVVGGCASSETHGGETTRDHDDPENLDGGEGENGKVVDVLEGETDEESDGLGDVLGEEMQHKLLDVVEHATSLLDGVEDPATPYERCERFERRDSLLTRQSCRR